MQKYDQVWTKMKFDIWNHGQYLLGKFDTVFLPEITVVFCINHAITYGILILSGSTGIMYNYL